MNKNLEHYIHVIKRAIPDELRLNILESIIGSNWQQHQFYYPTNGTTAPALGSKELDTHHELVSRNDEIIQCLWNSYAAYMDYIQFDWHNTWQGFSAPKYNRYLPGRQMANHCDHIHTLFEGGNKGIPIMTALALLNDEYKGGELIFFEDTEVKMEPGDIVIFPSNFLYPHKVQEVTEGVRYSLASWAW